MGFLIAEAGAITLFAGFIAFTQYEKYRSIRFVSIYREKIDRFAVRVKFVLAYVDFLAFIHETARQTFDKIAHDSAHLALHATRFIERRLAYTVNYFRARFAVRQALSKPVAKESSEFVRTITNFKQELRTKHLKDNPTHHHTS